MNNKHSLLFILLNFTNNAMEMDIDIYQKPQKKQSLLEFFDLPKNIIKHIDNDLKKTIGSHMLNEKQWWYPNKKVAPDKSSVLSVNFHPTKNLLATGSGNGKAYLIDICTNKKIASFKHKLWVSSVGFDNTGQFFVRGSGDHTVCIVDIDTNQEVTSVSLDRWIEQVCFDNIENLLAIITGSYKLYLLSMATKNIIPFNYDNEARCICFDSSGILLAIGSNDGKVSLYTKNPYKEIASFAHGNAVLSACFHPTKRLLATASGDGTARLFDLDIYKEVACFNHNSPVYTVHLSTTDLLATGSRNGRIRIFNINTLKEVASFVYNDHDNAAINSVYFNPSEKLLATGSQDGKIRIFAQHNQYTFEQLLLRHILFTWLFTKKPNKEINSPRYLLTTIATMFDLDKRELRGIWKTFPENMQSALWQTIKEKIIKYGK